jgi:hypothetical protein
MAQSSESVVREFCDGRASLDADRMLRVVKEDYYLIDSEGNQRLYNPKLAEEMCRWEKEIDTR